MPFSARTPPAHSELAKAGAVTVYNASGEVIPLGQLFDNIGAQGEGRAVVIFIRHFFCGLCQDYLTYLAAHLPASLLLDHNIKLSIVGCGDWKLIAAYKETLNVPFDVYADPSKKSYEALGMTLRTLDMGRETPYYVRSGTLGNIFSSIWNAFKIKGFTSAGDIKQLGGEFVFAKGEPVYTHRMENTRGHAPFNELLEAMGLPPQPDA
ncbi:hypothetical protein JCM8547_004193 [Rhodosporidiobolus lusitaniae]